MGLPAKIIGAIILCAALLLLAGGYLLRGSGLEPPALTGTLARHSFQFGGAERSFIYYVPQNLGPGSPVVLAFHSFMGSGDRMRRATAFAFDALADEHGFIVVYPDGFEKRWNDCQAVGADTRKGPGMDDVAFVGELLTFLGRQYPVNLQKVFALGLSNGGNMAFRLAMEVPDRVRGVAAIAAGLPAEEKLDCAPRNQAVAMLLINGTGDPVIPYGGGEVTLLGPFRSGRRVRPVEDTVTYWKDLAGYESEPFQHRYPDKVAGDDSVAGRIVWSEPGRPEVSLITVYGGGHTIPHPAYRMPRIFGATNRDFSAAEEIWRFFQRQLQAVPDA